MSLISAVRALKYKHLITFAFPAALLAALAGMAFAAQDRYALKLGKLAFADFKGYENWKNVAVSQTETLLKLILANDVMMNAYRKAFPPAASCFPTGRRL